MRWEKYYSMFRRNIIAKQTQVIELDSIDIPKDHPTYYAFVLEYLHYKYSAQVNEYNIFITDVKKALKGEISFFISPQQIASEIRQLTPEEKAGIWEVMSHKIEKYGL